MTSTEGTDGKQYHECPINLYMARFHQMRNSRDCRAVVKDRDLIFGMRIALGQATNEKSQKLENVAMVTRKFGFADFGALFDPEELATYFLM